MNFNTAILLELVQKNWKSGVTVAFISLPLSIALSVASGAGPLPGVITGIWATLIASFFCGNNYNIIGAAGALTTVLFAATLAAPLGLGASALPLIAVFSGLLILCVWAVRADRFLYYIPSSIMYGFAAGVAFLIAASQLFDATGLSALKRTGHFIGDVELFVQHIADVDIASCITFGVFLALILVWKRFIKILPAVIPVAIIGVIFGWIESTRIPTLDLVTLGDKFGSFKASLFVQVPWSALPELLKNVESIKWILMVSATVALIAVLETLITAQIADKVTKTQSSSRKELFGLALSNIGAGAMGGLPATGVFIRTGANIRAGATHRMSATIAAVATAAIALLVLPIFIYLPMAVIAAILVNTALGLIETHKFVEFYHREKQSFGIAILVLTVTVLEDAGLAVLLGAVVALLFFADRISHGYFDAVLNFKDGSKREVRRARNLELPVEEIEFVTYSIAGAVGYIDSNRHAANMRVLAEREDVPAVILRFRDLYSMDLEGEMMLAEALVNFEERKKLVYLTSLNKDMYERLLTIEPVQRLKEQGRITTKSEEAILLLKKEVHTK